MARCVVRIVLLLWMGACGVWMGCSTPVVVQQEPLTQDTLDHFLATARDPRRFGITVYEHGDGPQFEFANRPHQDRKGRRSFVSPKSSKFPVIQAQSSTFVKFNMLLDTSSRQSWLLFAAIPTLSYIPFEPPMGGFPDHVISEYPGYAGVAQQIIFDDFYLELPTFYVPPAAGGLGPLARVSEIRDGMSDMLISKARASLGGTTHAVMGSAMMRSCSYFYFHFPARFVAFSSHSTYRPVSQSKVLAKLPLLNWRGRPLIEGVLNGESVNLVLDTAGDFAVSMTELHYGAAVGTLQLGELTIPDLTITTHETQGLPVHFPPRLGLSVLSRYIITFDFKNNLLWIEDSSPSKKDEE